MKKLISAYSEYGNVITGGRKSPFTFLELADQTLSGGISFLETIFLQELVKLYQPRHALVIGNAFGWSAHAIGFACHSTKVIAMDICTTDQSKLGRAITNKIQGGDVIAEVGESPKYTAALLKLHKIRNLDLIVIDGLHTNKQLLADYYGLLGYIDGDTVILCHDVLNWHMESAFYQMANDLETTHRAAILDRCDSGMGVIWPLTMTPVIDDYILSFRNVALDCEPSLYDYALKLAQSKAFCTLTKAVKDCVLGRR